MPAPAARGSHARHADHTLGTRITRSARGAHARHTDHTLGTRITCSARGAHAQHADHTLGTRLARSARGSHARHVDHMLGTWIARSARGLHAQHAAGTLGPAPCTLGTWLARLACSLHARHSPSDAWHSPLHTQHSPLHTQHVARTLSMWLARSAQPLARSTPVHVSSGPPVPAPTRAHGRLHEGPRVRTHTCTPPAPPRRGSPRPTGVDGGFAGGHRHVGGVGHQRRALHDGLRPPVHLHGELGTASPSRPAPRRRPLPPCPPCPPRGSRAGPRTSRCPARRSRRRR